MEKNLYDDKIITLADLTQESDLSIPDNKSIIQLEASLLDMASTSELCQGVFYAFPVKLMDKYIIKLTLTDTYNQCLLVDHLFIYQSNITLH